MYRNDVLNNIFQTHCHEKDTRFNTADVLLLSLFPTNEEHIKAVGSVNFRSVTKHQICTLWSPLALPDISNICDNKYIIDDSSNGEHTLNLVGASHSLFIEDFLFEIIIRSSSVIQHSPLGYVSVHAHINCKILINVSILLLRGAVFLSMSTKREIYLWIMSLEEDSLKEVGLLLLLSSFVKSKTAEEFDVIKDIKYCATHVDQGQLLTFNCDFFLNFLFFDDD